MKCVVSLEHDSQEIIESADEGHPPFRSDSLAIVRVTFQLV